MNKYFCISLLFILLTSCIESKELEYYENGSIKKEVTIITDTAFVKMFYENGSLRSKFKSIKGNFHGEYLEYYYSGSLKNRIQYVNGKIENEYLEYYESGELYCKIPHKNNQGNGIATYYNKNGKEKAFNYWEGGQLFAIKAFTSSGEPDIEIRPIVNTSPEILTRKGDTLIMDVFMPEYIIDSLELCNCNLNFDFYNKKVAENDLGLPNELWNFCTSDTLKVVFDEEIPSYFYGIVTCDTLNGYVEIISKLIEKRLSIN